MSRVCLARRAGRATPGSFELGEEALTLTLEGGRVEVYPLVEVSSLEWDELGVTLGLPDGSTLALTRLGAAAGELALALRRRWPSLRARALRVAGTGEPLLASATVQVPGLQGPGPAELVLYDDVVVAAPRGSDVVLFPLAWASGVQAQADPPALCLALHGGGSLQLSRLGPRLEELRAAVETRRSVLAAETASLLQAYLPGLPVAARARLSGQWLPGRLASLAELEEAAPGFEAAFRATWLPTLPRRGEATLLLSRAAREELRLGFCRPGQGLVEGDEGAAEGTAGLAAAAAQPPGPAGGGATPAALLWLLARVGDGHVLEAVSAGDHAAYRFDASPELPRLANLLLVAPGFSREALYLPLAALTGDRGDLALPARHLPGLVALRAAFRGRVIHTSPGALATALGS